MASKLCDSCKSASATLFCRADAAFLCVGCDSDVHAANKLASRHARVWVCEVCEQAPAHVTCKADAAALCVTCDRDIHSANPLARRHERVPVAPIFDSPAPKAAVNFFFSDADADDAAEASTEEAEAASWLLPNPKPAADSPDLNSSAGPYAFSEMEPYLDLDYGAADLKLEAHDQNSSGADGVVPVVINPKTISAGAHLQAPIANDRCYEIDFSAPSKPFIYSYNAHCLSHSVSSSSLDVGVVPDVNAAAAAAAAAGDMLDVYGKPAESAAKQAVPMSAADREARVLRYREKRKNRKFEKTIRYASRKAYAETRPRIKGRFAKRTEVDIEADRMSGYGVVPTF